MNVDLNSHGPAIFQICHLTAARDRANAWVPQSEMSTFNPRVYQLPGTHASFFPASVSPLGRGDNNICFADFMPGDKGPRAGPWAKGWCFKPYFKGGFGPPRRFGCQTHGLLRCTFSLPFNASDCPFFRRGRSKSSMNLSKPPPAQKESWPSPLCQHLRTPALLAQRFPLPPSPQQTHNKYLLNG